LKCSFRLYRRARRLVNLSFNYSFLTKIRGVQDNMKEIKGEVIAAAGDGGTLVVLGEDGKTYYVDGRVGSKTKGTVYDDYPSEKATILDVKIILKKDV
jgi:hypothetical protein